MSYIGQGLPADTFQGYVTDTFTGDGSATTFTLSKAPFSADSLIVVIDNVIQQPTTNFTVSGTTLTIVGTAILSGIKGYAIHTAGPLPIGGASELNLSGASDKLILDLDGDTTISADTDDEIHFKAGGNDLLKLTASGLHFPQSGDGIYLGVTSETASNLLDDYEEGTFTATLGTTGTGFTTSSNTATCFYTKVGRAVSIAVSISVASPSSGSGNLQLTGLPFTSGSHDTGYSAAIRPGRITCTNGDGITANLFSSSSTISFEKAANASATTKIAASDLNGNTTPFLSFSMTYFV